MKKLILLAVLCLSVSANAQTFSYYNSQYVINNGIQQPHNEIANTKLAISAGYGVISYDDYSGATMNLTLGVRVADKMRVSLMGDIQLIGDTDNYWNIAAMLGTTELYATPYSRSFTEIGIGIGYQLYSTYDWDWDWEYGENGYILRDGLFFPIRFRWGYSLTKNMDFGLDLMGALTAIEGLPWVFRAGLFLGVRF